LTRPASIVWHYTSGPHQSRKFVPNWQLVHGFAVHPQRFTFNDDAVRVPSARQTKYNDKRANPKGPCHVGSGRDNRDGQSPHSPHGEKL
jgi:hypothetical protein